MREGLKPGDETMQPIEIKHRHTRAVLASGDSLQLAAVAARADLRGADLSGADLRGAYLSGTYLSGADLRNADLRNAGLRGAYLRGADLSGADLRNADLNGADLRGAYLRGADLSGAKINWQSHDLLAEILRQAADRSVDRRKVAGLILVSRDWCWEAFLETRDTELPWALAELARYATEDDDHPAAIDLHRGGDA